MVVTMKVHKAEEDDDDLVNVYDEKSIQELNSAEEERYKKMRVICSGCMRLHPGVVYSVPEGRLPCAYDGNDYAFDKILRDLVCPMNHAVLVSAEKKVNPLKASRRKAKGK